MSLGSSIRLCVVFCIFRSLSLTPGDEVASGKNFLRKLILASDFLFLPSSSFSIFLLAAPCFSPSFSTLLHQPTISWSLHCFSLDVDVPAFLQFALPDGWMRNFSCSCLQHDIVLVLSGNFRSYSLGRLYWIRSCSAVSINGP